MPDPCVLDQPATPWPGPRHSARQNQLHTRKAALMITVRLLGGLGNQLFQYATGRALALRLGVELVLDGREAARSPQTWLRPALHHFDIQTVQDAPLPPDRTHALRYGLWRKFGRSPRFLREAELGVNRAVLEAPDQTYLHGYFQSEQYFRDAEAQIRTELRTITPPSAQNAEWLTRLRETPGATAVHLRRGDYVADAKAAATHGSVGPDYYARAIAQVEARTGQTPELFVFSNDPEWCRSTLSLPRPFTVIDHNTADDHYEDLRLMAACQHHVIANSTFSWWGAWLGASPAQHVVAPAQWFGVEAKQNPDILPKAWHAL